MQHLLSLAAGVLLMYEYMLWYAWMSRYPQRLVIHSIVFSALRVGIYVLILNGSLSYVERIG